MKNIYKIFILVSTLFYFGCSNNHFIIYSTDGQILDDMSRNSEYINFRFNLYFNRTDIKEEFEELYIISTDNFYYGQFFFDDIFMNILKKKTKDLNADALIYEKKRKDFPFYNDEFLYFTVIRFKDKGKK